MGALYLAGYIATIGVATFLLKYVSDDLSPYQINFLMAMGMAVIGVPAVLIADRTLALPRSALPLGITSNSRIERRRAVTTTRGSSALADSRGVLPAASVGRSR